MGQSVFHYYATGAAAIAEDWLQTRTIAIHEIRFHASSALGAGDTLRVYVDSADGIRHDFSFINQAMNTLTNALYQPGGCVYVEAGDTIAATMTNAGTNTWSLDIVWSPV